MRLTERHITEIVEILCTIVGSVDHVRRRLCIGHVDHVEWQLQALAFVCGGCEMGKAKKKVNNQCESWKKRMERKMEKR